MSSTDNTGPISHDEAHQIAQRYNSSHWRQKNMGEVARYTIPADPMRDDDIRLRAYIEQRKEEEGRLRADLAAMKEEAKGMVRLPEIPEGEQLVVERKDFDGVPQYMAGMWRRDTNGRPGWFSQKLTLIRQPTAADAVNALASIIETVERNPDAA